MLCILFTMFPFNPSLFPFLSFHVCFTILAKSTKRNTLPRHDILPNTVLRRLSLFSEIHCTGQWTQSLFISSCSPFTMFIPRKNTKLPYTPYNHHPDLPLSNFPQGQFQTNDDSSDLSCQPSQTFLPPSLQRPLRPG